MSQRKKVKIEILDFWQRLSVRQVGIRQTNRKPQMTLPSLAFTGWLGWLDFRSASRRPQKFSFIHKRISILKLCLKSTFGFDLGMTQNNCVFGTTKWIRPNSENLPVFRVSNTGCFDQFLPVDMGSSVVSQEGPLNADWNIEASDVFRGATAASITILLWLHFWNH